MCDDYSLDKLEARWWHSPKLSQTFVIFGLTFHKFNNIRAWNQRVFQHGWKSFNLFVQNVWNSYNTLKRSQTIHHCICLTVVSGKWMLAWSEKLISQKTWFHHSLLDEISVDTPTSQWLTTFFPLKISA